MGSNGIILTVAGAILIIISFSLWPFLNGATNELYNRFVGSCADMNDNHFQKVYRGVDTDYSRGNRQPDRYYIPSARHGGRGAPIEGATDGSCVVEGAFYIGTIVSQNTPYFDYQLMNGDSAAFPGFPYQYGGLGGNNCYAPMGPRCTWEEAIQGRANPPPPTPAFTPTPIPNPTPDPILPTPRPTYYLEGYGRYHPYNPGAERLFPLIEDMIDLWNANPPPQAPFDFRFYDEHGRRLYPDDTDSDRYIFCEDMDCTDYPISISYIDDRFNGNIVYPRIADLIFNGSTWVGVTPGSDPRASLRRGDLEFPLEDYRWTPPPPVLEFFGPVNRILLAVIPVLSIAGFLGISGAKLYAYGKGVASLGSGIFIVVFTLLGIIISMLMVGPILASLIDAHQVVGSGQYAANDPLGVVLQVVFGAIPTIYVAGLLVLVAASVRATFSSGATQQGGGGL